MRFRLILFQLYIYSTFPIDFFTYIYFFFSLSLRFRLIVFICFDYRFIQLVRFYTWTYIPYWHWLIWFTFFRFITQKYISDFSLSDLWDSTDFSKTSVLLKFSTITPWNFISGLHAKKFIFISYHIFWNNKLIRFYIPYFITFRFISTLFISKSYHQI